MLKQESYSIKKQGLLDEKLTREIIAAAIEVHRELGPGLLESAYEACLAHAFLSVSVPPW